MTPPSTSRAPSASWAPAAYPGRMVFPPWWRTRRGATGRPGLGEIGGPFARTPLVSLTGGCVNRCFGSRTSPREPDISEGRRNSQRFQSLLRDVEHRAIF